MATEYLVSGALIALTIYFLAVFFSELVKANLANSITLTPGTFTINIIGDTLYIHCVDVEKPSL